MTTARRLCFTMQFPNGTTAETLTPDIDVAMAWEPPTDPAIRFVIWQLEEAPTTGHLHYQGYVEFNKVVKYTTATTLLKLPVKPHLTKCNGTAQQNIAYCSKSDGRIRGPWQYGEPGKQGKRNDLEDAVSTLKTRGINAVIEEHTSVFVKYPSGFREAANSLKKVRPMEGFVPRNWQKKCLDLFLQPPNDRTIYWVFDPPGGQGKSVLAKYLICNHGAIELDGRMQDMAQMIKEERIVIFDITRTQSEYVKHLYTFAEKLKNGNWQAPKYQSHCITTDYNIQVIFFSNSAIPENTFSDDRIFLIDLTDPSWHDNEQIHTQEYVSTGSPDLFELDDEMDTVQQ